MPVENQVTPIIMMNWSPQTPQMSEPSGYEFYLKLHNDISGVYDKALEYARQLEHPAKLFLIGLAHLQRWEDAEAEYAFRKYLASNPSSAGTYCNLAVIKEDNYDEAKALYKRGWELATDPRIPALLIVDWTGMFCNHSALTSHDKRRSLIMQNELRELLIATIRRLLMNAPFNDEWLLNNGGPPKKVRRLVEGPIDAHYFDYWVFGEAIVALNLDDNSIMEKDLIGIIKRWDHLVSFFKDSKYTISTGGSHAAFLQRDCCLEP